MVPLASEALSQGVRISARMINCQNPNFIPLYGEANLVFELMQSCFAHVRRDLREDLRRFLDSLEQNLNLLFEFASQPALSSFKVIDSRSVVQVCGRLEIKSPHFQPYCS